MSTADRSIWVKQNGQWVAVNAPSVNVAGVWTNINQGYVKVKGEWKQYYPSSGSVTFSQSGHYDWTVPVGIYSITLDIVAGGGGGSGSTEVGNGGGGGGGGSGGFIQNQTVAVTPGEIISIYVGAGGGGGAYIGRTSEPPPGADGAASSITCRSASIVTTGGQGGQNPTYYQEGGKIICTKLYELGLMNEDIYLADQAFGADLVTRSPDIYNGYRAWAEIVVDWMEGTGPNMMPWAGRRGQETTKQWAISWAEDIATPWAEEMAHAMGKRRTSNATGKIIAALGMPICKAVGVWNRVFGPSKRPAGFSKGLMLIPVFVALKLVAVIGKLFKKI